MQFWKPRSLLSAGISSAKIANRKANQKSFMLRPRALVRIFFAAAMLAIASTFVAFQAISTDTGALSTADNYLEVNIGSDKSQAARHPDINFTNGQASGTWEGWIFPTTRSGLQQVFSKEDNYIFGLTNGELSAYFQNGGWKTNFSGVYPQLNAWSHVAYVKSGTEVSIFLNGNRVANWANGAHATLSTLNTSGDYHRFHIGRRVNGEFFSGRIDEVRVWNYARTQVEITNSIHSKVAGNASGLQGYWDFNEPSGSIVYDRTTGGYIQNLTLLNSPSRADVKTATSLSNGSSVVTFPRTYLPGAGSWKVPANVTQMAVAVVGGGGGGGADGGSGGGGGELRTNNSQTVTPGGSVTIVVGQGGQGGSWIATRGGWTAGSSTSVSGAGMTYVANGGQAGGGWTTTVGGLGGSGGQGGTGQNGGQGGGGPGNCPATNQLYFGQVGSSGPATAIGASSSRNFGGGGGGGLGADTRNTLTSQLGRDGGSGGGGRGANYKVDHFGNSINGASSGQHATPNTGGGGGGGSACNAEGDMQAGRDGFTQRTDGGSGAAGIVIFQYTPSQDRALDLTGEVNSSLTGSSGVIPSGAFTVEGWIYLRSNNGQTIFSQGDAWPASTIYVATLTSGEIYLRWGQDETGTGVIAPVNRWIHFALTRDTSGNPTLFLDSVSVWAPTGRASNVAPGSGPFRVGIQVGNGSFLNGQVDQIKVWNTNLSASELSISMHAYGATQANGSAVKNGATLLAHYDFNEFQDTRIEPDRSGNGKSLAYGSAVSSNSYTDSQIIESGTAHTRQTYFKFNRSYLTATGGWTKPTSATLFKAVVVAGGGGGGAWVGGGGGAGGLTQSQRVELNQSVIRVQVGQGGRGAVFTSASWYTQFASSGQASLLGDAISTIGGGYGGSHRPNTSTTQISAAQATPSSGGSGGGGSGRASGLNGWAAIATGANGTAGQGNAGGSGTSTSWQAAGGGGAGAVGGNGISSAAGAGGAGLGVNITGSAVTLAGGGGGANHDVPSQTAAGGLGGGGRGGNIHGLDGDANTGGGGGGGANPSTAGLSSSGGEGGSGVVIISFGGSMQVTGEPRVARPGETFSDPITVQLKDANGNNVTDSTTVTLTASSNTVLRSGGTNVTFVTTTSVNGVATFSDVGFQSGINSPQTLTITADAFIGTSLTITPSYVAATVNITSSGSTSGVFINGVFQSNTNGSANILNLDLQSAMSSGSVLVESSGDITVQNSVTSSAAGSDLTLKAAGSININSSQAIRTNGGDVIVWSDSDATNGGVIRLLNGSEICTTASTCSSTVSGGGDVVLGGGAADADNPARPGGFASGFGSTYNTTGTTTTTGVQIGTIGGNDQGARIYSAGGNISIRGTSTNVSTSVWLAGTGIVAGSTVSSGNGTIRIDSTHRSANASYGTVEFNAWRSSANTSIVSTNTSDTAVVVRAYSDGGASGHLGIWGSGAKTIFDVAGGLVFEADRIHKDIAFEFDVAGQLIFRPYQTTLLNHSTSTSFELASQLLFTINPSSIIIGSSANTSPIIISEPLQATSGNIELLSSGAISKTTSNTLTAAADIIVTSRSSSIDMGSGALTAANIRISPSTTYAGSAPLTANSGIVSISGGTSVAPSGAIQASGNVTISGSGAISNSGASITSTSGNVILNSSGSTVTVSASLTSSTSGAVNIESASTVAVNANITSGSGGISIKSAGRIETSTGDSVASPRSLTTTNGPITLWTTGASGGVTLNNYAHLNTNAAGNGGGDITIGGGSADANNPNVPGGNAQSNAVTAVVIGTSSIDQIVRISAGSGNVTIRGESTTSSDSRSGITMRAGVKITGGSVNIFGKANNPSTTNATASGVFHYWDSTTAKTVIEATNSYLTNRTALDIRGETSSGYYGVMLSNVGLAATVADAITVRTTGAKADIKISGSTGASSQHAIQAAGLVLSTATGDVLIDSGDDWASISRDSNLRKVAYLPVSGQPGGNVTIRTPNLNTSFSSTGSFDVTTSGILTLEPPSGQAFSTTQTFPLTGSSINTGGVVVGSASNNQNINGGAAIAATGDVRFLGGLQTFDFAITTTNGGNIEFYPTTNFSKSTPAFNADGSILIGTSSARAASIFLSTGSLTAGEDIKIYNNQTLTQNAAMSAGGAIVLDTTGASNPINVQKDLTAGSGGILLKANQDILVDSTAKSISTSGGGNIVFWANASGNGGEVDTGGLSVSIDSNGGDVVIAGGQDNGANGGVNLDGIPDNSLLGRTAASTARLRGIIDSDAGQIIVRAQHSPHIGTGALAAVYLAPSASISSTTGDISIYGTQNSGNTSTGNQYGIWLGSSTSAASRAIVSSSSGDILISGDASQSVRNNRRGIVFFGVDISTGGDIQILGNAPSGTTGSADVITWAPSTISSTATTLIAGSGVSYLESTEISSGTGLTFRVGQLVGTDGLSDASFTSTPLSIIGSGPVVIEPNSTSFIATQSLNQIDFASTVGQVRVGKTSNTAAVTIAGNQKTVTGSVDLIAGTITISTNFSSSAGYIYARASENIVIDGGADLVTSGQDITLHSDSDATDGGRIHIQNSTTISTGSGLGDILISGGLDPRTGFASTNSSSGTNTSGVLLATTISSSGYSSLINIDAGAGDVEIRGQANGNSQGRGILIPRPSGATSIKGANVTLVGSAIGTGTWYGIDMGKTSDQTGTGTLKTLFEATNVLSLSGSSLNFDGVRADGYFDFVGKSVSISGSGPRQPINLGGTLAAIAAGADGFAYSGVKSGSVTNDNAIFAPSSFSSGGPVSITYDRAGSTGEIQVSSVSTTNQNVEIKTDQLNINSNISIGTGTLTLRPFTANRQIMYGVSDYSNGLSINQIEMSRITAQTLRLTTAGDVNFYSNLDLTGRVTNLAIRAGGNVTAAAGVVVTVANLGVDADGTVNFPANQSASVVALQGSTVTYNQIANYNVVAVDGITPEFGVGVRFALDNVDRSNTVDRFMAITFNPPPAIRILDKFNNVLAASNQTSGTFTASATMSVTRTDGGAPSLSVGNVTRSGSTYTFSNIRVNSGTGLVAITYSVTNSANTALVDSTSSQTTVTANYTIKAGEPASLEVSLSTTTIGAGKTGLAPVVTLKDSTGQTLTSGDHTNATVNISIVQAGSSIVSGGTASTVSGVASFPNLILGGTAANYTLRFGVTFTNSQGQQQTVTADRSITLTAGDPTKLQVDPTSLTVASRATLGDITVRVADAYNNHVGELGSRTIQIAASTGTNTGQVLTILNYSAATTSIGSATFTGLQLAGKVDNYTLTFSTSGLTSATQAVSLTHGAAHSVAISAPASTRNALTFGSNMVITILDRESNVVSSGTQASQNVTISANGATLSGTKTRAASSGVATFNDLVLTGLVGTKTLTASISSPESISANASITLTFGDATKLAISRGSAGYVNRVALATQPIIVVQDVSGNSVENYSTGVSVAITSASPSALASLSGTQTVAPSSGLATFSGLTVNGKVGNHTLTYTSGSLASVTESISLTHGAANKLTLSVPATATNDTTLSSAPSVSIFDQDDNPVTTGAQSSQNVTLSVANATFTGTTTVAASSGVASFPGLKLTGAIGSKTITATISDPNNITTTANITLQFGSATKLAITTQAAGFVNRTNFTTQPVVTVQDVSGNTVTNFAGTIALSIGNGASITGTSSLTISSSNQGVASFSGLGLQGTVGTYTITASSNGLTSATQTSVSLTHGAANKLTLSVPATATNDTTLSSAPSVSIFDQDDNPVTTGAQSSQNVTLSVANATFTGTTTVAASSGVASFPGLKLTGAIGSKTITATISDPNNITTTANITLQFGSATKLAITTQAAGFVNRTNFTTQPVVTVQDVSGNTVTNFAGTIALSIGNGASITGTSSLTISSSNQGVASFSGLGLQGTVGTYTITASSNGLTSATQTSVSLTHGAANKLTLSVPATATNDTTLSSAPSVSIFDQDDNPVTTGAQSSQNVTLSVANATFTGTTTVAASSGVASFPGLKLTGAIGSKTITATISDPNNITTTANITLQFGSATKLAITTQAAGFVNRTNFTTQPVVTVQDVSGNTVTNFAGTIALSIGNGASITGTSSLTISSSNQGVASFSGLGLQGTVGTYTITASSNGLTSATQTSVSLTHGTPSQLAITQIASGIRSGQVFDSPFILQIRDADGNVTTSGSGATAQISVTKAQANYSSGGADLAGTTSVSAIQGVATFSDLKLSGVVGNYDLTFAISSPNDLASISSVSQRLALLAGAGNSLSVVQQPTDVGAGVAFSPTLKVQILDAWNNRVLADSSSSVSALRVDPTNTSSFGTIATATSASGLAEFVGLNITQTGDFRIRFTSNALTPALSNQFKVIHGPASKLAFSNQPTSARSDVAFSPVPVLRLLDQYDNPVVSGPTYTVSASVVSANSGNVQQIVNGQQASVDGTEFLIFSGMKMKATVGTYKLRYTATSGSSTFSIDSSDIQLGFGIPAQLNILTPAATARAGVAFVTQPVIEVRDSAGNRVADSTLAISASVTGRDLVGSPSLSAVSGVADFSATGLGIAGTVANSLTIQYSAQIPGGSSISASQTIDLVAGPTRYLHILQQPTQLVTRGTFTPAVKVQLRDQYQNPVLSDSSTQVSATLYKEGVLATATNGQPALQTITKTAGSGVADFSDLTFAVPPASGYYLKFALPSDLHVLDSSLFEVVPGPVASITIDQQPGTLKPDTFLTMTGELIHRMPEVSLYDQDGYLTTNAVGSVAVAIASGANGSLSEGSTSATITNGRAVFSGIKLVGRPAQGGTPAQQYRFKFSFNGVDSAASEPMSVTHNVASKLILQRAASGGRAGEVFTTQPIIQIQDRYSNIVESSNAAIRVGASAGGSVSGREVSAQSGIATFTSLALGGLTTNTYSLTFEIPNTAVQTVVQSGVTLTYGVADKLVLTTEPRSLDGSNVLTKTGDALATQPVVKVFDRFDNLVANSNDIVTATIVSTLDARDRLENATVQAVNGVATFNDLKLIGRPGQTYRLSFTSGTLTNTQSGLLQVRHGNPHTIEITTQPSSVIDAVAGTLTRTGNSLHVQPAIRVLDFDGNLADSISGINVSAIVSSGGGNTVTSLDSNGRPFNEAVISSGIATFSELKVVATPGVAQTLQFTSAFQTGSVTSIASSPITLTNALARSLALHIQPCAGPETSSCAAGVTGNPLQVQPVVKVLDEFGNLVVDHVGSVFASVSGSGSRLSVNDLDDIGLRTANVVGGHATFSSLALTATPGIATKINFSSENLTGVSSRDLFVAAASPVRLEMVIQPVGERTGNLLSTQPQVKLVDRFGNTVLSDSTTVVTASASGGILFKSPSSDLSATALQGVVTFSGLKFTGMPGDPYQLTFSAAGLLPATSANFSVTNALASTLTIATQPVVGKTGDLLTQMPVLELRDFDGNLAEDDDATVVTVSIDVSNGAARFVNSSDVTLLSAPTATAVDGVVSFQGLRIVAVPGTVYKLNFEAQPASGSSFASPPSNELIFTHADPAQLIMRQSAVGGLSGAGLSTQPVLEIKDRFGNPATLDNSTVVTAVIETGSNGVVVSGASATAVAGIVTFSNLVLDGRPDGTYTLGFNAVSAANATFRVVDSQQISLSRPATLALSMADVTYAPDLVVTPVFTKDSPGVVTWSTTTDSAICVLEQVANVPTGNIIVKGVGTCALKATVAPHDYSHTNAPVSSYLANEISANLVINKANQATLSLTNVTNVDYRASLTLGVTGGSGDGVLSYFASGDCRVIGGVLLPGEAGAVCQVFARKLGDANYNPIDSATQSITINRIAQSDLRIANARSVAVGDIELFTAGGSGTGEISYQVSTPGTAQCQIIDGNILRATSNGTCAVMATKQASTNYLIAISPQVTFTFSKAEQVVNFTSALPAFPTPGSLYEPAAVSSSGLPVSISITGGLGTICEFDAAQPSKVKFLLAGNCILTATQAGSSQFNAASKTLTIAVDALNQTITFAEIPTQLFGNPKMQLTATASSNLPVTYSLGQTFNNPGCTVTSSGMVTLTAAGMCEIVASQAGSLLYSPAPNVTRIFSIAPDQAGAPHVVSVSVSNQAITAKFRAPSYLGGSQVSAYRLEATNGNGDVYVNPGCSASGADLVCELVGMPLNIAYSVKVAAITAAGIGVYSEASIPVTPGTTEIAVMSLSADQSQGELLVTWEQPLALDGVFDSYQVYVWPLNTEIPSQPTQTIQSVSVESATFTVAQPQIQTLRLARFNLLSQNATVPPANAYHLKVVTITDESSSAMTDVNVASGVQIGLGVPGRPRNEVLSADNEKMAVVWSQPHFDGGSEVTHYMIRKAGDDAPPCGVVDPNSAAPKGEIDPSWNYSLNDQSALLFEQENLVAGTTYQVAIFACNSVGASLPAIVTHAIPAPPASNQGGGAVTQPEVPGNGEDENPEQPGGETGPQPGEDDQTEQPNGSNSASGDQDLDNDNIPNEFDPEPTTPSDPSDAIDDENRLLLDFEIAPGITIGTALVILSLLLLISFAGAWVGNWALRRSRSETKQY